jgi:hypothetical protein
MDHADRRRVHIRIEPGELRCPRRVCSPIHAGLLPFRSRARMPPRQRHAPSHRHPSLVCKRRPLQGPSLLHQQPRQFPVRDKFCGGHGRSLRQNLSARIPARFDVRLGSASLQPMRRSGDIPSTWGNGAGHSTQVLRHPVIGALPLQEIDTALAMKVVEPTWRRIPVTGARLRGRCKQIWDSAKATGLQRRKPVRLEDAQTPASGEVQDTQGRAPRGRALGQGGGPAGAHQHQRHGAGIHDPAGLRPTRHLNLYQCERGCRKKLQRKETFRLKSGRALTRPAGITF